MRTGNAICIDCKFFDILPDTTWYCVHISGNRIIQPVRRVSFPRNILRGEHYGYAQVSRDHNVVVSTRTVIIFDPIQLKILREKYVCIYSVAQMSRDHTVRSIRTINNMIRLKILRERYCAWYYISERIHTFRFTVCGYYYVCLERTDCMVPLCTFRIGAYY